MSIHPFPALPLNLDKDIPRLYSMYGPKDKNEKKDETLVEGKRER